jgi:hypothetical protein
MKMNDSQAGGAFPMACEMDSRFRGNDRRFEVDPAANDKPTDWAKTFLLATASHVLRF